MSNDSKLPRISEAEVEQIEIVKFCDFYGVECSLQQSSLADYEQPGISAVRIGTGADRMYLRRKDVATLAQLLSRWLADGSFGGGAE